MIERLRELIAELQAHAASMGAGVSINLHCSGDLPPAFASLPGPYPPCNVEHDSAKVTEIESHQIVGSVLLIRTKATREPTEAEARRIHARLELERGRDADRVAAVRWREAGGETWNEGVPAAEDEE